MKKGLTELIFILDQSGSMGGLEGDTIGGYNSMLVKQQAVETAGRFGIGADRAVDYLADGEGTELSFKVMSAAVAEFREKRTISNDHFEEIRGDVRWRGDRK